MQEIEARYFYDGRPRGPWFVPDEGLLPRVRESVMGILFRENGEPSIVKEVRFEFADKQRTVFRRKPEKEGE